MFDIVPNSLEYIRMLAESNLLLAAGTFWLLYVAVAIFSLPGAGLLTISSGAIFGVTLGGSLSATSAWLGATIIFLIVKYTSSTYFQSKIEGSKLSMITDKIKAHEFKGMLLVRVTPVVPFFATNIIAGVLGVKNSTYMITTAVGMFWSFIYAGVGAGLFEALT